MKNSILIHGDQKFFCQLLSEFCKEIGFVEVMESTQVWDAVVKIRSQSPEVVMIDARRSKDNGMDDALIIKGEFPGQKIVLLSASSEPQDVLFALNGGIDGYFLKSCLAEDIKKDLEAVCRGELRVSRDLVGIVVKHMRELRQRETYTEEIISVRLTPREREILCLLSNGETNKEIARELQISTNTVKNHIISILSKLNVHTRTGAVAKWRHISR